VATLESAESFYKGIAKHYSSIGKDLRILGSATVSLLGRLQELQLFADLEQTVTFQNYLNHIYDGSSLNMKDIRYLVSQMGQHHEKVARYIEEEILVRLEEVIT